jgi:dihydroxyacetone kinase
MTSIHNDPATFKDDLIEGFVAAYGRYVERVPGAAGTMRAGGPREGKVSVVIGGGSGHYPAFCGLVGPGFADGAVIGDVFTSPSMEQAYRVARALDGGAGVLFSFGNYAGDVMNFGAAQQRLRAEGIDCRTVLVTDDIASAARGSEAKRRGIAGDFTVFKIAGAAADRGLSIHDVERVASRANALTRSFGVAFGGCTLPGAGEPLFTVAEGSMDFGLGIHGEPGVRSVARLSAARLAEELVRPLLAERPDGTGGRAAVILNGLGGTKYEELFVLWKDVLPLLESAGVEVVLPEVGELVTSLDMRGCSLTITWLDDELEELWTAPADTPAFRRGGVTAFPAFAPRAAAVADAAGDEDAVVVAATPQSLQAAELVRRALLAMRDVVAENEQELGRLDAVAGDGDHGTGMLRGLRAAVTAADGETGRGAGAVLRSAGGAWADKAGGTSGMLWGALLQTVGDALGDEQAPDAAALAAGLVRAGDRLRELGRSDVGDKTLLDTLIPFAAALERAAGTGAGLRAAWSTAQAIAEQAARDTASLMPKVGRARPLAQRSLGTPDPGAVSMALCIGAVAAVLEREALTRSAT